jgi:hypothetical protein
MLIGLALAVSAALYPSAQWEWRETVLLGGRAIAFFAGLLLLRIADAIHKKTQAPLPPLSLSSRARLKRDRMWQREEIHGNR